MATATGIYHRTYRAELALRHTRAEYARLILMSALLLAAPYLLNNYWLGITNTILIAVIGAVGLNILVGFTGTAAALRYEVCRWSRARWWNHRARAWWRRLQMPHRR